jgi:hypothetical protein
MSATRHRPESFRQTRLGYPVAAALAAVALYERGINLDTGLWLPRSTRPNYYGRGDIVMVVGPVALAEFGTQ